MANPDVRLKVDGSLYGGWQQISIRRSMEYLCAAFDLTLTDRWAGTSTARPIRPGAACTVLVDGTPIIAGYVDDANPTYTDRRHGITVSGRDLTGDLLDCSAPSTQFSGRTLDQVAKALCKPYGIGVSSLTDVGAAFATLKNNEGDTVFETLEQAARIRAVLILSDGLGNLILSRAGTDRLSTALATGKNILECEARYSHRDRYSKYTVKGQTAGSNDWYGEDAAQPMGSASDSAITRYRPLTVLAESSVDKAAAAKRAEWERNVRFGRSRRLSYTVPGWFHANGLWEPNHLVRVRDAYLGLDDYRLISGVNLTLNRDGFRAVLELVPRETFVLVELPEATDLW
jgi:prophage tail gpP-like protein